MSTDICYSFAISGSSAVKNENRHPNSSSKSVGGTGDVTAAEKSVIRKDPKQDLEERVKDAKLRYYNLERRNKLEMEGYENEITMLRRKLNNLEKIYS